MNLEISIPHGSYPASVRDSVEERLAGLEKVWTRVQSVRAVLDRDASDHRVELIATPAGGPVLVVDTKAPSLGQALDASVERMGRAMKRRKEKLEDKSRNGG
jgi:ribosomal subunit interface protein